MPTPQTLLLFNYDWDVDGFEPLLKGKPWASAGFDLFAFPSNVQLVGFDLNRFTDRLARRYPKLQAVASNNEQFGALAAALLAKRLGLPGTPPEAVVACQHKLHARRVLAEVAPECSVPFALLDCEYGIDMPEQLPEPLRYPVFVKPVKAAFSVLAKTVHNRAELQAHTRFGWRELWVIKRLVEPFDRIAHEFFPGLPPAHRLVLEHPAHLDSPGVGQFNLDGVVFEGKASKIGVVDSIMYPGTQAFMRFDYPTRLSQSVQNRAMDVATRFLSRVGFCHGLFNMEFFYDAATDRLTVIEFNPRLASQSADLYLRVDGINLFAVALALARGESPDSVPRVEPTAGAASSFVYRCFEPGQEPPEPSKSQQQALHDKFADVLLLPMPKHGHSRDRDYTWLGSHRYGIVHLGGRDAADLRTRCEQASAILGWPTPYVGSLSSVSSGASPAPMLTRMPQPVF